MKRTFLNNLFVLFLFLGFVNLLWAQSDREIVDNFKKEYSEIEQAIKDATSLEELNAVVLKIDSLKLNYAPHKELLDKSLYPDKYDVSIEKLNKAYLLRQGDFATIDVLQTQVGELKQQVDFLTERNNELILKVRSLEAQTQKDAKTIKKLQSLVAELQSSIQERDDLVLSMVDSLMPPIMRERENLSAEDKNKVASEERKNNVLNNVKTTIRDNIRFMKVTSLKPADLRTIREQQKDFAAVWRKVGVRLVEVYAGNGKKSEELKQIDELFDNWYAAMEREAWDSINEEFLLHGIELRSFENGQQFTSSVLTFIGDELKNHGVKSDEEAKRVYASFADSTWFAVIEPVWMTYLVENKMLTDEEKNQMESKIAEWRHTLYPSYWWIYLIIAVVVIAGGVFMFLKGRKPKATVKEQTKE
jgi:hypothetical protein